MAVFCTKKRARQARNREGKMDVICIGETLIDFIPGSEPASYVRNPGGGPANASVAMARNGLDVGIYSKLGNDDFGRFLKETLEKENVRLLVPELTDDAVTTMEDYRARAQAIANAEIFEKMYAISECPAKGLQSPTVICAQAANELLNVVGIKASFVMTEFHDMVYISARAIDEVNVQIIMAALGSPLTNKYAEGYPGHRYYGGCEFVDVVEKLAIERAEKMFGCTYANVQPHSGAQANFAVFYSLLQPGDTFMSGT